MARVLDPPRFRFSLIATVLVLVVMGEAGVWGQAPGGAPQMIPVPQVDWGWEMLEVREFAQRQNLDQFEVEYDFQYSNQLPASGIAFINQITPDSGKYYQPNHYDHGNGVIAADVDGDELYDLYFVSQLGSNELWKNLGNGRFEDITQQAGVGLADRVGASASFADVDNDGDPDLFVTTIRMGNAIFLNDGVGVFTEVTTGAGLDYTGHSSGATFFDYDGDGRLDLFLSNVGVYTVDRQSPEGHWIGIGIGTTGKSAFKGHLVPERTEFSILYRNTGGHKFADVSADTNLRDAGWTGDASFYDANQDGKPDLYVLNMQGDDHFYINENGKSFSDQTGRYFPQTPWGSMGIKFFDYNNDGHLDLILTDMHSDMSRKVTPGLEKLKSLMTTPDEELQGGENNIFGNAFWVNQGNGSWVERSDQLGLENYWPWGVSVGDLNADGWEDVFISSSMNFPFEYGINSVLLNNRGKKFLDSEFLVGVEPRRDMPNRPWYNPEQPWLSTKKPWFELDCAAGDRSHMMCRGRREKFVVMGNVGSRSAVIFDLDNDGDLDIVTNEYNDVPQVLISNLAQRQQVNFLKIELVGKQSNRDGIGAVVQVKSGPLTLTQQNDGKSGYLSQSSLPLYFGLGASAQIDSVTVRWPSGREQVLRENLAANTLLSVEEQ